MLCDGESVNNPRELFTVGKQGDSYNYFTRVLKSDQRQIRDLTFLMKIGERQKR